MKTIKRNLHWIYENCKSSIPYLILIVLIGSFISLISVGTALTTKTLIYSAINNPSGLEKWMIVLAILLILHILLTSLQTLTSTYCSEKIKNQLQEKLYNHIIYSTWIDHSKYHSVDLLTRITNDVNSIVNMIINTIPGIISLLVMLISSFFALMSISSIMSVVSLSIFPFLILLSKIYGRRLRYFYLEIQKKEAFYNKFLQESFNNILIVKSFCLEQEKRAKLKNIQKEKLKLSLRKSYYSCVSNGLFSLSSLLGYFSVFIWGSINLSANNPLAFGNITAMIQLFTNIQNPIYGLSTAFPQLISALAATDRLLEIENMILEDDYNYRYISKNLSQLCTNESKEFSISSSSTKIIFKNVSFAYSSYTPILSNICFSIQPGEIIALVGPSGSGKTTLIRLLLSLINPHSGNILINSQSLNISHRNLISYVPQGNTLFSGSILENLKLGNSFANSDDIDEALRMSCAFKFVNSLKDKTNTIIGEKGLGISEGQAQRLAIARAFLRKKPILILDEATSSLDPETELNILKQIKNLNIKPICIIITHRSSAFSICDKILKLENHNLSVL